MGEESHREESQSTSEFIHKHIHRPRMKTIIGCIIIVIGTLWVIYPFLGAYINSLQQHKVVQNYRKEIASLEDDQTKIYLEEARKYNKQLFERSTTITDLSEEEMIEYNKILNISVTGILGYIDIPEIKASLPIYHGTEENVLQVGIGHLAGSSFPIGDKNTHAILTGHSGLPTSDLFTNLDRLEIGDTFTVTVLNNVVTYKIFDIKTVLPEEAKLEFEEGRDLCTLVTCTPIGINTHRLLVCGENITNS